MRDTAVATSVRGVVVEEYPDALVDGAASDLANSQLQRSAGTPFSVATPTPSALSAGANASGANVSPGPSVEESSVSEGHEIDDRISPELGGKAARELR